MYKVYSIFTPQKIEPIQIIFWIALTILRVLSNTCVRVVFNFSIHCVPMDTCLGLCLRVCTSYPFPSILDFRWTFGSASGTSCTSHSMNMWCRNPGNYPLPAAGSFLLSFSILPYYYVTPVLCRTGQTLAIWFNKTLYRK